MLFQKNASPSLVQATANPDSVFQFAKSRFTLLTQRLIRIECSPDGYYEDRPSQVFWYRKQALPNAAIQFSQKNLMIETDYFLLTYKDSPKGLTRGSFMLIIKETGRKVHLDELNPQIFPGTTRTLDQADGKIPLQPGLLSRSGWVQINDTQSLLFNANGWLEPRPVHQGYRDLYFLVSGSDYKAALQDYQRITGTPPLLPRAFLGNWWSRYWAYTQDEIQQLVEHFQKEEIPLSTYIIDMDWHITKTGNSSTGWTGFSWNRELFPDPPALLNWLHKRSLITALNLHPADGIYPHEEQYDRVAAEMGLDPEKKQPVPFDLTDPKFVETYFTKILHPIEEQGVDFWWLDWQQGELSKLPGLDPLWWLNHLHFNDQGKDTQKRPVIFSRWGGPGNHRYPIGFSGDTVVSWESLAFQPYFNSSAANAAYGWWSHDIGGHMQGEEDGERYVRWVQFGVLSPIFRLHSTKDIFIDRHPWAFGAEVLRLTRLAMQFRHALVPYLYTMSHRNAQEGIPLCTPLYYDWPLEEAAYQTPNQYLFGTNLMAAPVCSPANPELGKTRQSIWFPPGDWFDFFSGKKYTGGTWKSEYYDLSELPLFARAGSIIPLQAETTINGTDNPESIDLLVFPGADGSFTLYEDNGVTQEYLHKGGTFTTYQSHTTDSSIKLTILPAKDNLENIPADRTYRLFFRGIQQPECFSAIKDGKLVEINFTYDHSSRTYVSSSISLNQKSELAVELMFQPGSLIADPPSLETEIVRFLKGAKMDSITKWKISTLMQTLPKNKACLKHRQIKLSRKQKKALLEIVANHTEKMEKHDHYK